MNQGPQNTRLRTSGGRNEKERGKRYGRIKEKDRRQDRFRLRNTAAGGLHKGINGEREGNRKKEETGWSKKTTPVGGGE